MQQWIEDHGGRPATVAGTPLDENGLPSTVEISFDPNNQDLQALPWPEFFDWVEYHSLALRYDNAAPDGLGMFEFVDRQRVEDELDPASNALDSGDPDMLKENLIPDAE